MTRRCFACNLKPLLSLATAALATLPAIGACDLRNAVQTVYKIGVSQADGKLAVGSAVLIEPGVLITNCHTTRHAQRVLILHPQGELEARAGRMDAQRDLCILLVPELRGPVVERLNSSTLQVGQAVMAVGFDAGFRLSVQNGEITELFPFQGGKVVRSSATFPRGASGGGLFDDQGRLIGILTFKGTGSDELNYALPVEWIDGLVKSGVSSTASRDETTAFWEDGAIDPPMFLQYSWLLENKAFEELEVLAVDWVVAEPHSADAWLALGRAEIGRERFKQAAIALHEAVARDPSNSLALYWLAVVYQRITLPGEFIVTNTRLREVNPQLALRLRELVDGRER